MRNIVGDKLFRASSLFFVCMMFGNVSSFLYQAFMGRALSVEEFGILNSLLSIGVIISLPIGTLNTAVANVTSRLKAQQAYHSVSDLFYRMLLKVLLVGTCGIAIFVLCSNYLREFLNLSSIHPLLILGTLVLLSFLLSVNFGVLQGLQHFNYFGILNCLNGFLKLILGTLLVYAGFGVKGAIGGIALGTLIIFLYSGMVLHFSISKLKLQSATHESNVYGPEVYSYSGSVLIALLCFTSLTNVDLVLVKHFFLAEEAGTYAVAAVLGKAILFLPGAIVLAMFPMASESHTLNDNPYHLLKKSLAFAGILSFVGIQAYIFFPELLVTTLMGNKHTSAAHLVRVYGLAMLPFVFINIFMFFNLATHRMKFLYTLIAGSFVEIMLIYMFHTSLQQVIYLLISIGCVLLALNTLLICTEMRKSNLERKSLCLADIKSRELTQVYKNSCEETK